MSGIRWRIERFEDIGSTNSHLLEAARRGAPEGLVAVANHQSAGRGRLDRRWESPPGAALMVSVLLRPRLGAASAHLLTGAVALAACTAVSELSGFTPGLKWPNDLVADGAKLAGILAETDASAPGGLPDTTAVVVGLGLNLTWPGPEGAGGTSLELVSGKVVERDALLDAYLAALGLRLGQLATAAGRTVLGSDLAAALVTLGQDVTVVTTEATITGRASALSADGHLIVTTATGPVEIITGDVHQLRTTPGGVSEAE